MSLLEQIKHVVDKGFMLENSSAKWLLEKIEALQQENKQLKEQINTAKIGWDTYKTYSEQLQAKLDEWKYEAKCHMDEVAARDKEIDRLKAQDDTLSATVNMLAPDEIEALRKAREAIKAAWSDGSANAAMDKASEALTAIDKAIGGKEDE